MEENKLTHSIFGTALSWLLTILAWSVAHMGVICGIAAVAASIYSIRASKATIKLRNRQRKNLEDTET